MPSLDVTRTWAISSRHGPATIAIAHVNAGSTLVKTGRVRKGLARLEDAVRIDERVTAADPPGSVERTRLAQILVSRGEARELSGSPNRGTERFRESLDCFSGPCARKRGEPPRSHGGRPLPFVRGAALGQSRPDRQAAANFEKALGIWRKPPGREPGKGLKLRKSRRKLMQV